MARILCFVLFEIAESTQGVERRKSKRKYDSAVLPKLSDLSVKLTVLRFTVNTKTKIAKRKIM